MPARSESRSSNQDPTCSQREGERGWSKAKIEPGFPKTASAPKVFHSIRHHTECRMGPGGRRSAGTLHHGHRAMFERKYVKSHNSHTQSHLHSTHGKEHNSLQHTNSSKRWMWRSYPSDRRQRALIKPREQAHNQGSE